MNSWTMEKSEICSPQRHKRPILPFPLHQVASRLEALGQEMQSLLRLRSEQCAWAKQPFLPNSHKSLFKTQLHVRRGYSSLPNLTSWNLVIQRQETHRHADMDRETQVLVLTFSKEALTATRWQTFTNSPVLCVQNYSRGILFHYFDRAQTGGTPDT